MHNDQMLHAPQSEFDGSKLRDYPEHPYRIWNLVNSVKKEDFETILFPEPTLVKPELISSVHSSDYVSFLQNLPDIDGSIAPTGFAYPHHQSLPDSFIAKLGYYFFDPSTPLTNHTFQSAVASVSTGVAVADDLTQAQTLSIGLCRPPGHHAMKSVGGGYCFFNNAAIAAQYLVERGKSISILDLDFHHGNGTQEIFYRSNSVQYVSIHADPKENYPYYWGSEHEQGIGDGLGYNHNLPISNDTNEDQYSGVLDHAIKIVDDYNPDHILVSLGFDCFTEDPIAGMNLSSDYYSIIGSKLHSFQSVGILLEGGYAKNIGRCFINLLRGFEIE